MAAHIGSQVIEDSDFAYTSLAEELLHHRLSRHPFPCRRLCPCLEWSEEYSRMELVSAVYAEALAVANALAV